MINLQLKIKTNKPNLVDSSVNTYTANIQKLHQKMFDTKDVKTLEWLHDFEKVIKFLKDNYKSYLSIRNILNALVVLLLNEDGYNNALISYQNFRDTLNDKYQKAVETGEMTPKETANWLSLDEINAYIAEMNKQVNNLKLKPGFLNIANLDLVQTLFLIKFHTVYPLRSELADTQIVTKKEFNQLSEEDICNNNYMILSPNKVTMNIAKYKTKGTYGTRSFTIDDKHVLKYLRNWLKVSPNPKYVLINLKTEEPLTRLQLTQYFLRIFEEKFNKKISSTMLRKIVVTSKHGKAIRDLDDLSFVMCHSRQTQATVYNKTPVDVN